MLEWSCRTLSKHWAPHRIAPWHDDLLLPCLVHTYGYENCRQQLMSLKNHFGNTIKRWFPASFRQHQRKIWWLFWWLCWVSRVSRSLVFCGPKWVTESLSSTCINCFCADMSRGLDGILVNCLGSAAGLEALIVFMRVGMNSWSFLLIPPGLLLSKLEVVEAWSSSRLSVLR